MGALMTVNNLIRATIWPLVGIRAELERASLSGAQVRRSGWRSRSGSNAYRTRAREIAFSAWRSSDRLTEHFGRHLDQKCGQVLMLGSQRRLNQAARLHCHTAGNMMKECYCAMASFMALPDGVRGFSGSRRPRIFVKNFAKPICSKILAYWLMPGGSFDR